MKEILDEFKEVKLQYEKYIMALDIALKNENAKELDIKFTEEELENLKTTPKNNFLNNFLKIIHIGKGYKLQQEIDSKTKKIKDLKIEVSNIQLEKNILSKKIKELEKILMNNNIHNFTKLETGEIVITDFKSGIEQVSSYDQSMISDSERVIVHTTNFFPKNNIILTSYDGGKIEKSNWNYRGVPKEVLYCSHRHTVHCTINNRVQNTGDGVGNWDDAHIIIIDRYDIHKDQMYKESENSAICTSDAYTDGSIKLSKDAVIMVRIQDKGKLPILDDELSQYNIVYYDGDPTICLNNFLHINGYNIFELDRNSPAHSNSLKSIQESVINRRDRAVNFLKNNTYNGKEQILLSERELLLIMDIAFANCFQLVIEEEQIRSLLGDRVNTIDNLKTFINVANFMIQSGVKLDDSGMYTFKSDEEIFEDLKTIKTNNVNVELSDLIYNLYRKYEEIKKILDSLTQKQIKQFIDSLNESSIGSEAKEEEQIAKTV